MSLYDYEVGKQIVGKYGDDEFYGIIQAAMRLADTDNLEKLKVAWPEVWADLQVRYNAPGGNLPDDTRECIECGWKGLYKETTFGHDDFYCPKCNKEGCLI